MTNQKLDTKENIKQAIKDFKQVNRDSNYRIESLLGLLNSKLVNYYFKFYNQTNHVPIGEIKKIPVQPITENNRLIVDQIQNLVEKILELKKQKSDTTALESEIDLLVYKLYDLTPAEIKIIEEMERNFYKGGRK
jgi:hypothetical protein